jgi:hypothetical protein
MLGTCDFALGLALFHETAQLVNELSSQTIYQHRSTAALVPTREQIQHRCQEYAQVAARVHKLGTTLALLCVIHGMLNFASTFLAESYLPLTDETSDFWLQYLVCGFLLANSYYSNPFSSRLCLPWASSGTSDRRPCRDREPPILMQIHQSTMETSTPIIGDRRRR